MCRMFARDVRSWTVRGNSNSSCMENVHELVMGSDLI